MAARQYLEDSRTVAIGLMTSPELSVSDIKLLQASLNVPPNGTLDRATGQAIARFLSASPNTIYSQSLSPQIRETITRPGTINLSVAFRGIGNPHIEGVLAYPGAFDDHHVKRLQTALYIQNPDGHYGQHTQDRLIGYLEANPDAWANIGPSLLRLMLSDADSSAKIRDSLEQNKPPEYTDRVRDLIAVTQNASGLSARTYELQLLLNAGGFYAGKKPDGMFDYHTQQAVSVFEAEYKGRIPQTDTEPLHPVQTADLDPFTPTPVPMLGTYMRIGQFA
jgi:hypothetical protein